MKSIKRESLTDSAIREIKKYLLSGKLREGDKIPAENELAGMLGVGRSTVREATRTLAAMGYVEMRPGRGAFAVITSKEAERKKSGLGIEWFENNAVKIYEWQEARACLEPQLAYLAATKATDEERKKLTDNVKKFQDSVKDGDDKSIFALESEFHMLVACMTHNPVLRELYNAMTPMFSEFITNSAYRDKDSTHTVKEHKKIADAIIEGNAVAAKKAMEEHLSSSVNKQPV